MKAVALLLLSVTFVLATEIFNPEESCSKSGGMCMLKDDCPDGLLAQDAENLCPQQKHLGAACCYGLPKSWTGCSQRGGECMTNCPDRLTMEASDCPANTKCCVLV